VNIKWAYYILHNNMGINENVSQIKIIFKKILTKVLGYYNILIENSFQIEGGQKNENSILVRNR
jgi:hypothetical protein